MTQKLFNTILATCLLFGSLNLPAHAEAVNKPPSAIVKLTSKKSPEAHFLDGNTCLKQSDIICAKLALAGIPSTSPYAKLLQGSIAFTEQQIDKSLLLLLPLQAEKNLNTEAKITLHQYLASAFESIDDTQQAIQHLMQAESVMADAALPDKQTGITANHQKIWGLLNKLDQNELIAMRGDNTDNYFQGWIDLCLAARNQDLTNSLNSWAASYADHPALEFAKNLSSANVAQPATQNRLSSEGSIALILPLATEADSAKSDAFKQGLEASLTKHDLHNEIKVYPSANTQQDIDEIYTLAKNEGNAYFVVPNFNLDGTQNTINHDGTNNILHVGLFLSDEAQRIASFATSHGIQHITIVTTDHETSKLMVTSFQAAWQAKLGITEDGDTLHIITLPNDILSASNLLLDLKSQIAAKIHDMVLLAMPAHEARLVKPHLDISTPTMAFSSVNETARSTTSDTSLNAVRFVDIPFLLTDHAPYADYRTPDANLNSNELLRWFALGVDALQLLMIDQQSTSHEVTINGLTGSLTVDKSGNLKRQLSVAKFTYNGIVPEQ